MSENKKRSYQHENDGSNDLAYNEYVISDGIWARLEAQTNADILDMLYTKARKKIRQRGGGMLSTQDALELVMKEDREEIINDIVQDLRKEGYYLLADAFQNESTREDAIRVLRSILNEMESPD